MRGYDTKPASRGSRYEAPRKTQEGESNYEIRYQRYKPAVGSRDAALRHLRALKDKDMISGKESTKQRKLRFVCVLSETTQKPKENLKKLIQSTQKERNEAINEIKLTKKKRRIIHAVGTRERVLEEIKNKEEGKLFSMTSITPERSLGKGHVAVGKQKSANATTHRTRVRRKRGRRSYPKQAKR